MFSTFCTWWLGSISTPARGAWLPYFPSVTPVLMNLQLLNVPLLSWMMDIPCLPLLVETTLSARHIRREIPDIDPIGLCMVDGQVT